MMVTPSFLPSAASMAWAIGMTGYVAYQILFPPRTPRQDVASLERQYRAVARAIIESAHFYNDDKDPAAYRVVVLARAWRSYAEWMAKLLLNRRLRPAERTRMRRAHRHLERLLRSGDIARYAALHHAPTPSFALAFPSLRKR
jgi:hypothetical protein